jgi:Zn-dependent alcohol dehydrogenase
MSTTARVVVLPEAAGSALRIDEVELPDPGPHQVLLRELASGICHSQLHQMHGPRAHDVVLGHEATGEVLAVGESVTNVGVGDRALLTFVPRDAPSATRRPDAAECLVAGGRTAIAQNIFTWADHTLADEQFVVKVPDDTPMDVTAIVGCAVMTGAGGVLNAADVQPGNTVAVWGVGGVGLPVVAAARQRGASMIIAVDVDETKLEMARTFGATHTVNAAEVDGVAKYIRELTPGPAGAWGFRGSRIAGVDVGFDCVALPQSIEQMLQSVRNGQQAAGSGGTAVVLGVPQEPFELDIVRHLLTSEKRFLGSIGGTSVPERDFPTFLQWHSDGSFDLDTFVTQRFTLDEINEATAALEAGQILGRSIIEL